MSLIDAFMEDYVIMEKRRKPDGAGGFIPTWEESEATINAAVILDTSMQARIAEKEDVKNVYTVTISRSVDLEFHDVIKNVKTGKYYRITSDPDEKHTPDNITALDMKQGTAEKWELTK
ncbi:MAG: head-tail adaptor protein [Dorea sp.]|nr:head-tail adaptor protein [Dorea sp.]